VQGTFLGEETRMKGPNGEVQVLRKALPRAHEGKNVASAIDCERSVVDSRKPLVQKWIGSTVDEEESLRPSEKTTITPSFPVPQEMSPRDPQGVTLPVVSSKGLQTDIHDHPLLLYPSSSSVNKVKDARDEEDSRPSPIPTQPRAFPQNKNGSWPSTGNITVVASSMVKNFPGKVATVLRRTVTALSAKTSTNAHTSTHSAK